MSHSKAENVLNSISAPAPPLTPLGSLQRFPDLQLNLRGPTSEGRDWMGREGKGGGKWKGRRRSKRRGA